MDDQWWWEEVLALVQAQRAAESPTFSSDRLARLEVLAEARLAECRTARAEAVQAIARPTARAAEALRSVGVRLFGLSTVQIDPIDIYGPEVTYRDCTINGRGYPGLWSQAAVIADQQQLARPSHPGCAGCLHYDNNPYLACAVHPLGRPGEVCGDWAVRKPRFAPEVQWAVDQLSEDEASTNSPEHEPGGCDRGGA